MTNNSVKIKEIYTYKDQTRIIEKVFKYNGEQWTLSYVQGQKFLGMAERDLNFLVSY